MLRIKIDPNRLNDLSAKTRNIENKTNECKESVGTVINRLDWEVSSKASINTRLNKVQKRLQRQAELMDAYIKVLGTTNDNFRNKDAKLKQDAKSIIYEMNSISANIAALANIKLKTSYKTDDKLNKLFSINNLFGISSSSSMISLWDPKTWGTLKNSRDLLKGIDDISNLISVFFDKNMVEKYLGWAGELKETKIFEFIGYAKDTEKLINAIKNGDIENIEELGEKYLKKGAKSVAKITYGFSGFTSAGYINIGWNFIENVLDVDKFSSATSSNSDLVGFGKYVWHCTGGVMFETGFEMGYDIVNDVGKIFNYDLDKVYEDLTGVGGVEGFNKALSTVTDELFGDYYNGTISSGVLEGTATLVGDSLSWWGDQIAGLFD